MDDLLDVSFNRSSLSTAPLKPTVTPNTVNAQGPAKKPNAFDLLFPSSPATTSPRATSPAMSYTPRSTSTVSQSIGKQDAFGDLFGNGGITRKDNVGGMSMAERLKANAPFGGSGHSSPAAVPSPSISNGPDPWDFDLLSTSTASTSKPTINAPLPTQSSASGGVTLLDDFGDFSDALPAPAPTSRTKPAFSRSDSLLADFDISAAPENDDLDGNLLNDSNEVDFLGELGKPVQKESDNGEGRIRLENSPSPIPQRQNQSGRVPSPPPHVLGDLVLMGFSVVQAKNALKATAGSDGTWNVEAAVEIIVNGRQPSPASRTESSRKAMSREEVVAEAKKRLEDEWGEERDVDHEERRRRYLDDDDEKPPSSTSRRRSPQPPAEGGTSTSNSNPFFPTLPKFLKTHSPNDTSRGNANTPKIPQAVQDQASVLVAQASAFGLNVFKSANKFYQTSQATLQKALDERSQNTNTGNDSRTPSRKGSGRPKWMTDNIEVDNEPDPHLEVSSRFKDGDDIHRPRPPVRQGSSSTSKPPTSEPSLLGEPFTAISPSAKPSERQPYISSARRKVPTRENRSPVPSTSNTDLKPIPPTSRSQSSRPASPKPPQRSVKPPRPIVSAQPQQLATAGAFKNKGNEFFKLGRFGDAEQQYTKAIETLPDKHLALLPLFNNRANARLKTGDNAGVIRDCSLVIELILGRQLDSSNGLTPEDVDENLGESDPRDCLGKALSRRAKAHEASEKWDKALQDWLIVLKSGEAINRSAGGTKIVSEGVNRCRQIVEGRPAQNSTKRPVVKPVVTINMNSEKVQQLRAANVAAEAEAAERLNLKDSIDEKIQSWKGGKEANLRALIASLDNVLWPELGWKTVGMHELVTDKQVKIRYMKAIAKLHPDKLESNTTTEQRMIANGVFNGLNDAWNASK